MEAISELLSPTLLAELRRIELSTRRSIDSDVIGDYRSAFRGSGLIYSDVREYVPGDDVKHIHWSATARTGTAYVKSFDEDRQLRVLVALDISNSSNHGTPKTKHRKSLEFAALVTMLAQRSRDSIGLCLFAGEVEEYIAPGHSRRQFQRVLLSILQHRELPKKTNLASALASIREHQRRRSIIFLVSDFLADDYEHELKALSQRHDVVCVLLEDILDHDVPAAGIVQFIDAETGQLRVLDTSSKSVRKALADAHHRRVASVRDRVRSSGADFLRIENDVMRPLRDLMHLRRSRRRRYA